MEVNGRIKGDVSVEEGLSAESDEVATHGEKHVWEQERDGSRRAAGHNDSNHRRLWDSCGFSL